MSKEREALKLALQALEKMENCCPALDPSGQDAHDTAYQTMHILRTVINEAQPEQHRFFCSRCGKRLGLNTVHTCCPPAPTGWDNGLSQDYDKKLGAWFSEKPNAKEELRARTFDDYGNKII